MVRVIDRLRRRRSSGAELNWLHIPACETPEVPSGIADLLGGRLDGMTIQGVISDEEATRLATLVPTEEWMDWTFGALMGRSVGMLGSTEQDRSDYFEEAHRSRRAFRVALGFDLHGRIADVLGPMSGGLELKVPEQGSRSYLPGQLRSWLPGRSLPAHIGNEFHDEREDTAVDHLASITAVKDHLSYFVVLQAPDAGGALSVYDLTQAQDDGTRHGPFGLADRDDSAFDEISHIKFTPAAGDMIIFGGGWRWHRVDPVEGSRERVTYGGFCAPSHDGESLHFWA